MPTIQDIFGEIDGWEREPINELLGSRSLEKNSAVKRIAVCGPTQVGKTMMILNLIGIKPELQDDLGKLLRGGAREGSSSTSAASVYNRWDKDQFGICSVDLDSGAEEPPKYYSEGDLSNAIAEINSQNREGRSEFPSGAEGRILYYYFPQHYFTSDAPDNLQIVDMPGFGERNVRMEKKIDRIIETLSRYVAGAIFLTKSHNVTKLGSEFKQFYNMYSPGRQAIVLSYGISTAGEVKSAIRAKGKDNLFYGCNTDREKAVRLSEFYRKIIERDNLYSFQSNPDEQMVFPVERLSQLKANYPEYIGLFAESIKMLRERVKKFEIPTSIDACVEELAVRCQKLKTEKERLENELSSIIEKYEKAKKEAKDMKGNAEAKGRTAEEKRCHLDALSSEGRILQSGIDELKKGQLLTRSAIEKIGASESTKKIIENAEEEISETVHKKLGNSPKHLRQVYDKLCGEATQIIGNADYSKGFKKRDRHHLFLKYFGPKSVDCAAIFCQTLQENLQQNLDPIARKMINKNISAATQEWKKAEEKFVKCQKVFLDTEDKVNQNKQKIEDCETDIKKLCLDIQYAEKERQDVVKVFVKHYRKKEKELKQRINKETSPEKKVALLLVWGAIYLKMKPNLSEE